MIVDIEVTNDASSPSKFVDDGDASSSKGNLKSFKDSNRLANENQLIELEPVPHTPQLIIESGTPQMDAASDDQNRVDEGEKQALRLSIYQEPPEMLKTNYNEQPATSDEAVELVIHLQQKQGGDGQADPESDIPEEEAESVANNLVQNQNQKPPIPKNDNSRKRQNS